MVYRCPGGQKGCFSWFQQCTVLFGGVNNDASTVNCFIVDKMLLQSLAALLHPVEKMILHSSSLGSLLYPVGTSSPMVHYITRWTKCCFKFEDALIPC